jgi:ribosomal protein S18 acetylase RimI-like enzyme
LRIRVFQPEDYDMVFALWKEGNLDLGVSDTREEVLRMYRRNPDLILVGELDDRIVAAVMGGFDGRRGIVHHLAVAKKCRHRNLARAMMEELERRFRAIGVVKINFWVQTNNLDAVGFYEKIGYHLRDDLVTMSKVLRKK